MKTMKREMQTTLDQERADKVQLIAQKVRCDEL